MTNRFPSTIKILLQDIIPIEEPWVTILGISIILLIVFCCVMAARIVRRGIKAKRFVESEGLDARYVEMKVTTPEEEFFYKSLCYIILGTVIILGALKAIEIVALELWNQIADPIFTIFVLGIVLVFVPLMCICGERASATKHKKIMSGITKELKSEILDGRCPKCTYEVSETDEVCGVCGANLRNQ